MARAKLDVYLVFTIDVLIRVYKRLDLDWPVQSPNLAIGSNMNVSGIHIRCCKLR